MKKGLTISMFFLVAFSFATKSGKKSSKVSVNVAMEEHVAPQNVQSVFVLEQSPTVNNQNISKIVNSTALTKVEKKALKHEIKVEIKELKNDLTSQAETDDKTLMKIALVGLVFLLAGALFAALGIWLLGTILWIIGIILILYAAIMYIMGL